MKIKRMILGLIVAMVTTIAIHTSCSKEKIVDNATDNVNYSVFDDDQTRGAAKGGPTLQDPIWMPKGFKKKKTDGGMELTVPAGWDYVYRGFGKGDEDGEVDIIGAAGGGLVVSIICECLDGIKGCEPFIGEYGTADCQSGDCTTCKKTGGVANVDFIDIKKGGFVNPDLGITIAKAGDKLPLAFEEMFEIDELKSEFNKFIKEIYGDNPVPKVTSDEEGVLIAPDKHKFVAVNLFGRGGSVLLPDDYVEGLSGGAIITEKTKCECLAGGTNCPEGALSTAIWGCNADKCQKCKLDWGGATGGASIDMITFRL